MVKEMPSQTLLHSDPSTPWNDVRNSNYKKNKHKMQTHH